MDFKKQAMAKVHQLGKSLGHPLKVIAQNQKGMSLIEIMIVLVLIGLTTTFISSKIIDRLRDGRIQAVKIQMSNLAGILKEYRVLCNHYPTTEQGLDALVSKPTSKPECRRYPPEGFIGEDKDIPLDPWDNEYVYTLDSKNKFRLASMGPDGTDADESDYIYYGAKRKKKEVDE